MPIIPDNFEQPLMITQQDFDRLETKIDNMAVAVTKLILVEERQTNQGERIGNNEKIIAALTVKYETLDRKLDQWINRGIGVWAVVLILYALFSKFYPLGH